MNPIAAIEHRLNQQQLMEMALYIMVAIVAALFVYDKILR